MRFLICGLGSIGWRHLQNLDALGQSEIAVFRTGKGSLPDGSLSQRLTFENLGQALLEWEPDAAIISNPTSLHLETALTAAEAGCHLLVEKPVAQQLEGLDRLGDALESRDRQALIGFQFRYHPGLKQARQLLMSGAIGQPISARAVWGEYLPDWHPWEDYRQSYSARSDLGGGVLLTLCHPFDYLRWLFGTVDRVTGVTRRSGALELDVEDAADVLLEFQSGLVGSVHLDYHQRPAQHNLTVVGSQGTLRWDNASGETQWWTDSERAWRHVPAPEGFERNDLFLEEMRHFLDVVRGTAVPVCSLHDGVEALRIALGALQSAEAGHGVDLIHAVEKDR